VAQLARAGDRARAIERKGEHVGGGVAAPVLAVERLDALRVYQLHREVPVAHPGGVEGGAHRRAQLGPDGFELDAHPPSAAPPPPSPSAPRPRPPPRPRPRPPPRPPPRSRPRSPSAPRPSPASPPRARAASPRARSE